VLQASPGLYMRHEPLPEAQPEQPIRTEVGLQQKPARHAPDEHVAFDVQGSPDPLMPVSKQKSDRRKSMGLVLRCCLYRGVTRKRGRGSYRT
jgi:hypothetical protein